MRARKDPVAMNFTFLEVVTADESAPRKLRDLKNRCLVPGIYVQHLSRWLDYYPARQVTRTYHPLWGHCRVLKKNKSTKKLKCVMAVLQGTLKTVEPNTNG